MFLLLLAFIGFSIEDTDLKKVTIADDISVLLPESFTVLSEQEINDKYISYRKPLAIYSDPSRRVDFGVNVSVTSWGSDDLDLMKQFFRSNILNLYDEVEFVKEEVQEINGISYAVFEFISQVNPDKNSFRANNAVKKYTYVQYALVNGKTLLFNFTAPFMIKDRWEGIAQEVMQSVKVKKSF